MNLAPVIMYSGNNKVFRYDKVHQEFYVLYDFNLSFGDTLTIQDKVDRGYLNINLESDIALFQVIVDFNVVQFFNGYSLRHLYTTPTSSSQYFFNGSIIERIGNKINMFGEQI